MRGTPSLARAASPSPVPVVPVLPGHIIYYVPPSSCFAYVVLHLQQARVCGCRGGLTQSRQYGILEPSIFGTSTIMMCIRRRVERVFYHRSTVVYRKIQSGYTRITIPVLWANKSKTCANDEYSMSVDTSEARGLQLAERPEGSPSTEIGIRTHFRPGSPIYPFK